MISVIECRDQARPGMYPINRSKKTSAVGFSFFIWPFRPTQEKTSKNTGEKNRNGINSSIVCCCCVVVVVAVVVVVVVLSVEGIPPGRVTYT